MSFVVAVDVGGTDIKTALIDSNLHTIESRVTPTPKNDVDGVQTVAAIAQLVTEYAKTHKVEAVGLAVPGTLDEITGIARWTGNLGWHNLPIRDLLAKKLGLPVAFKHDVRAGAVAEMRMGAAQGFENAIFLPIGTGIAAAFILDGEIRSSDGFAGEVGHINIGSDRLCVCGKKGCLEATSSTRAISDEYTRRTSDTSKTTKEIVELAIAGDPVSKSIWDEAIVSLIRGCEYLSTLLGPEVIVLGGGLAESNELLLAPLRTGLESSLTFQRKPKLVTAHFGASAGTIGCALIALDLLNV